MQSNLLLWLTVVSALLGAITHSLSADGGASILEHFGVKARLPAVFVPVMVLVAGFGSDAVDKYLAGGDVNQALAAAALAAIGSIFGAVAHHSYVNAGKGGGPSSGGGVAGAAVLVIGVALAFGTSGCGLFAQAQPYFPSSAQDQCVLDEVAVGDTNVGQILTKCGIDQTAKDDVGALIDALINALKAGKMTLPKTGEAAHTMPAYADVLRQAEVEVARARARRRDEIEIARSRSARLGYRGQLASSQ